MENNSCIICLISVILNNANSDDTTCRIMPCGHVFHVDCVERYVKSQSNEHDRRASAIIKCPVCRTSVTTKPSDSHSRGMTDLVFSTLEIDSIKNHIDSQMSCYMESRRPPQLPRSFDTHWDLDTIKAVKQMCDDYTYVSVERVCAIGGWHQSMKWLSSHLETIINTHTHAHALTHTPPLITTETVLACIPSPTDVQDLDNAHSLWVSYALLLQTFSYGVQRSTTAMIAAGQMDIYERTLNTHTRTLDTIKSKIDTHTRLLSERKRELSSIQDHLPTLNNRYTDTLLRHLGVDLCVLGMSWVSRVGVVVDMLTSDKPPRDITWKLQDMRLQFNNTKNKTLPKTTSLLKELPLAALGVLTGGVSNNNNGDGGDTKTSEVAFTRMKDKVNTWATALIELCSMSLDMPTVNPHRHTDTATSTQLMLTTLRSALQQSNSDSGVGSDVTSVSAPRHQLNNLFSDAVKLDLLTCTLFLDVLLSVCGAVLVDMELDAVHLRGLVASREAEEQRLHSGISAVEHEIALLKTRKQQVQADMERETKFHNSKPHTNTNTHTQADIDIPCDVADDDVDGMVEWILSEGLGEDDEQWQHLMACLEDRIGGVQAIPQNIDIDTSLDMRHTVTHTVTQTQTQSTSTSPVHSQSAFPTYTRSQSSSLLQHVDNDEDDIDIDLDNMGSYKRSRTQCEDTHNGNDESEVNVLLSASSNTQQQQYFNNTSSNNNNNTYDIMSTNSGDDSDSDLEVVAVSVINNTNTTTTTTKQTGSLLGYFKKQPTNMQPQSQSQFPSESLRNTHTHTQKPSSSSSSSSSSSTRMSRIPIPKTNSKAQQQLPRTHTATSSTPSDEIIELD